MVSLPVLVEQYLGFLRVERGLSENTLQAYKHDLLRYVTFLEKKGVLCAGQVVRKNVTDFVANLQQNLDGGQVLAASSLARAVVAVRGLHKFWLVEQIVTEDVTYDVLPPAVGKRLPKAISVQDVDKILSAAKVDTVAGLRDKALAEFLYATGARISELVALDVDNILHDSKMVRLFGKGSKERIVPVGSYAWQALETYLVRSRPNLLGEGKNVSALFLNVRGGRLSRQTVWVVLKQLAKKANYVGNISPHTFRHSFATHLLEGGANIRVVQELLGHSSVTTTQIYTLVTVESLREMYLVSHPRAL